MQGERDREDKDAEDEGEEEDFGQLAASLGGYVATWSRLGAVLGFLGSMLGVILSHIWLS